jgi:hypothetical protein
MSKKIIPDCVAPGDQDVIAGQALDLYGVGAFATGFLCCRTGFASRWPKVYVANASDRLLSVAAMTASPQP